MADYDKRIGEEQSLSILERSLESEETTVVAWIKGRFSADVHKTAEQPLPEYPSGRLAIANLRT